MYLLIHKMSISDYKQTVFVLKAPFGMVYNQGVAVETTPGFNRLKRAQSICQNVFNTSQYESKVVN